jgi:hypothetical protein
MRHAACGMRYMLYASMASDCMQGATQQHSSKQQQAQRLYTIMNILVEGLTLAFPQAS